MGKEQTDTALALLKLRIAVAFLGEKEQCAWWNTRFLGAAGLRFLGFNYPKSAFAAGVTAASEAAKIFHDKRVGVGRVCHLFRLPHSLEENMYDHLLSPQREDLKEIVVSKDSSLSELSKFKPSATGSSEGPVCVGEETLLSSGKALPKIASFYFDAFTSGKHTLPYFTTEKG